MATDVSKATVRGLLVPDLRLSYASIAASVSSYEQAGPLPGVPEAQNETEMILEASGTQSASKQLRIRAAKAGQPTPDGGAFLWCYAGSAFRGWDAPHALSYFETIDYTTTAGKWGAGHAITLADGTIVFVAEKSGRYVKAWRRTVAGVWSESAVYDNVATYAYSPRPTVLALPSGRLLCYYWIEDTANATNQVRMSYSDDGGVTWALGSRAVLAAAVTSIGVNRAPKTLRAAYLNGQILIVAWVTDTSIVARADVLYQYASSDLGASFVLVDAWEGTDDTSWAAYPSLFVSKGAFYCHYLTRDTATTGSIVPYQRKIANAFQLLSAAPSTLACQTGNPMKWGSFAAGPPLSFTAGELSSWVDEDGVLYMAGEDFDAGALNECYVQRSIDGGATWSACGSSAAPGYGAAWWNGRDAATHPSAFVGTAQAGRAVLIHRFAANPDNHDDSLCASYLGGYSSVTLPQLNTFPSPADRVAWERTWVGLDLPENSGAAWTLVVGGAPVAALSATGLNLTGGGGDSQSYTTTTAPASTLLQGLLALVDVAVTGGTGFVDVRAGVAGPSSYYARVSVTATGITLRDLTASADVATVATTEGATGVQVLLAVGNPTTGAPGNDGQVSAWYRATGSGSDRLWTLIGASTTLQVGAFATNQVRWGMLAGGGSNVTFRQVCYSYGAYAGENLYGGQDSPGDLQGRNFAPSPVFVDDGVKIAAVDGPAFYADVWNIDTRYEYGIENVFPEISPSPARGWRSVGVANEQGIALDYDAALNERAPGLEPVIGLALFEINFQSFYLEGYDGAAWVTLALVDTATGQDTLKFTRQADTVFPQALAPPVLGASSWFTYHVLADSYFAMSGEENEISWNVIRKIRTNGEGVFSNATTKPTRIELYDVQPGDPTGAIAFEEGAILSKDVVVLVNNATRYTRLRLRIPAQDTCEGYFKIGTMVLGHVVTFAWQYSRGRALNTEPNTALTTSRSGLRRARRLGKARRSVEVAWVDGVDVSQATATSPAPNYVTGYTGSTLPIGSPYDTPYVVAGVAEQLSGAAHPVVYLAGFTRPAAGNVAIVLNNRNTFLLSRLVSPVRLESRLGSEWGSPGELFNVATITLEEEV